jgi:hypothetical protein
MRGMLSSGAAVWQNWSMEIPHLCLLGMSTQDWPTAAKAGLISTANMTNSMKPSFLPGRQGPKNQGSP